MRRNTILFVAISVLSGFAGSAMALVVGVWILDLTGSSGTAALAGVCVYAPQLAGPWLGDLVDRLPRRPLLIGVNVTMCAALLSLFTVRTPGQVWLLFAVSLVYGVSYVVLDAADTALAADALPPTRLAEVNGWRASGQEGMKLVAPLAGAGLYAWRGGHAVAALTAAIPAVVAALYTALRPTRQPADGARSPGERSALQLHGGAPARPGIRVGLAVLCADRTLRVVVALAAVSIAMSGFQTAATYTVVTADLRLPATFLGVLASAQGAGSVASGLLVGRLVTWRGPVSVGVAGTVLFAGSCLIRCLPWWPASLAASVGAGIGLPWTLVAAVTAVQTRTPPALLGRVAATANTAMFAPIAVAIPLGSAAVALGSRPPLVVAAAACLAAAASVLRTPASRTAPGQTSPRPGGG